MKVNATRRARAYILDRGARVYVWSGDGEFLHTTTEPPAGVDFDAYRGPGFETFIEHGLLMGDSVTIQRDLLPPWKLSVVWNGMAWSG